MRTLLYLIALLDMILVGACIWIKDTQGETLFLLWFLVCLQVAKELN
jgi:hypothetical protein